jgi:hypothetical protein
MVVLSLCLGHWANFMHDSNPQRYLPSLFNLKGSRLFNIGTRVQEGAQLL